MWPTSFAILEIGPAEEKKITALLKKAVLLTHDISSTGS